MARAEATVETGSISREQQGPADPRCWCDRAHATRLSTALARAFCVLGLGHFKHFIEQRLEVEAVAQPAGPRLARGNPFASSF